MSHLPAPLPPPPGENGRRVEALRSAMRERILVLDGAMGTLIQNENLKAADFGGAEYEGCNEHLVLTRPDVIERIHAAYFAAGADVTETDSFGGTPVVLAEFGLGHKAIEINAAASRPASSIVRSDARITSSLALPNLMPVETMPVPTGFVRISASPGCAPRLVMTCRGLIVPVTA